MKKRLLIVIGFLCIALAIFLGYSQRKNAIAIQETITHTVTTTVYPSDNGNGEGAVLKVNGYNIVGILSGNKFKIPLEDSYGNGNVLPAQLDNNSVYAGNTNSFAKLDVQIGDELSLMDMSGYTKKYVVSFVGRSDSTRIGDADLALFKKRLFGYEVLLCRESV